VNEADGQELRELRFKVGDALPADDPLARFVLVVSMGLNDNSLSNTRFVNTKEPYELLYFFRLASGHLHELAKRLRRAHEEWPEVQEFVADLPEDFRHDFESIVRLADPNDDVGQKLERFRNEFFHYPDLRRKTAERGKLPLMQALTDAADTEGPSPSVRRLSAGSARTSPTSSSASSSWSVSVSTTTNGKDS
jgi:hypothetical protein